ncbi:uncharacterized protein BX664DRAFT_346150 [Halteromyces radiatus]|uniref:uncharacterized protein n=1 Tax=Halteromyces radiatus TaxID=101107 RepID=UPI0022210C0F|nr:uncharacterized protein BX664DRAFT_346150 [Halteromyces radiatus]KAI8100136.1 hypothetical protein BX664DRAFT_346150 [Halteromyces radiatus]
MHEQLTLSFDDKLGTSFAEDLISQFDLKRDLLHTVDFLSTKNLMETDTPFSSMDDNVTSLDINMNSVPEKTTTMATKEEIEQVVADSTKEVQEKRGSIILPSTSLDLLPTCDTTLPSSPPLTMQNHQQQEQHETKKEDIELPSSITMNILSSSSSYSSSPPPTLIDRTRRRQQNNHNLLRRSSAYLRQKFFSAASTPAAPPTPVVPAHVSDSPHDMTTTTLPSKTTTTASPLDDTPTKTLHTNNNKTNDDNTGSRTLPIAEKKQHQSRVGKPPNLGTMTAPSSSSSSSPPPPHSTLPPCSTPMMTPCQYPPKPLRYSPVDPPNDHHRVSFPILSSWRKRSLHDPRRQSEPIISAAHIKGRRSFFFL